jgi:hypothetical protein
MNAETFKNNLKKDVSVNKVNVNVLKNRLFLSKKKQKFQYRIVLGSLLVSIGLIGYFVS